MTKLFSIFKPGFYTIFPLDELIMKGVTELFSSGWSDAKTGAERAISVNEIERLCMDICLLTVLVYDVS